MDPDTLSLDRFIDYLKYRREQGDTLDEIIENLEDSVEIKLPKVTGE